MYASKCRRDKINHVKDMWCWKCKEVRKFVMTEIINERQVAMRDAPWIEQAQRYGCEYVHDFVFGKEPEESDIYEEEYEDDT